MSHSFAADHSPSASLSASLAQADDARRRPLRTLRAKTILIIVATLVGLLVLMVIPLQLIVLGSFQSLESQTVSRNIARAVSALQQQIDALNRTAGDYATWDDTYAFVQDTNASYVEANLADDTFANSDLNLLLIVDQSGAPVFRRAFDLATGSSTSLPARFTGTNLRGDPLLRHASPDSEISGVVMLPEGPMLIASRPIVTSEKQGPIRGTLIMGRFLDATQVQRLAETTRNEVGVVPFASLGGNEASLRNSLLASNIPIVQPLNDETVVGYSLIRDISGEPSLVLGIEMARSIYAQGRSAGTYLILALLTAGIGFGMAILILLERVVLKRLANLSTDVRTIGSSGDLAARVGVSGDDELTYLANSINSMLGALARSQDERRDSEERYRAVVAQAAEGIFLVDAMTARFLETNAAFNTLLGYGADELLGHTLYDVLLADRSAVATLINQLVQQTERVSGEQRFRRADGGAIQLDVTANLIMRDRRRVLCFVARDMSERKRAEEERARRQSEAHFQALVRNTSDVILIVEPDGAIRFQSPAAARAWGYAPDHLDGSNMFDLVHADDVSRALNVFAQSLNNPGTNLPTELRLRDAVGKWRACEVIVNNLLADPGVSGIVVTCRDISERKAFEAELAHMAFHDTLSRLPNRVLFTDRLSHALARAQRRDATVAVMFVDLDNFKVINDSLGHHAGDSLLIAVTERLRQCLRPEDTLARFGGDEFTVLLEDVQSAQDAVIVAGRIQDELRAPFVINGHEVFTSASIGIALSAPGRDQPNGLLRDADVAMYGAKTGGKAHHVVFDHSMNLRAMERLELETDLRRAIERDELRVHYQPIVHLANGVVAGVEALVRWAHPRRGLIPPQQFIALAEETGLILPLGQWVLEAACRQVQAWRAVLPSDHPLLLSVNLSTRQLQHPRIVADVADILARTGFDPQQLELEITESILLENGDSTLTTLHQLKQLGIQLAIDDFGTGYSSLAYLRRFPIDTLKIDRSFVDRLGRDPEDTAIVQTITTLAKTLNHVVIGEGVETDQQYQQLRELGCDRGQGYFFARPTTGDQVLPLLVNGLPEGAAALTPDAVS